MTTSAAPAIVELADGVFARMAGADRTLGFTNSGIVVGDDSVLVVEGLAVPRHARDLIADVRRLTSRPLRYVVNTHSHWDHSFGNEAFGEALVIGHANARTELETVGEEYRRRVLERHDAFEFEVGAVRIRPPELTFDTRMALHFGGRPIDLRYFGRAHTAGDIFVHLPADGIVFTGDVAQVRLFPLVTDGFLTEWPATASGALDLGAAKFVPGHGTLGHEPDFVEARDLMAEILAKTQRLRAEGVADGDAPSLVVAELTERFGGWRNFDRVSEAVAHLHGELGPA